MKKFFLLLIIPFSTACSQTKDHKSEAAQVLTDIQNHQYEKAIANLDTSIISKVDTTKLRKTWESIIKAAGPFQNVIEVKADQEGQYDVVIQRLQFEKKKIDFKLVFNKEGKIKGLTFLPGEPRKTYKDPEYLNRDLIVERTLSIKNGPFQLPGRIITPKKSGRFPVIIMIHGSGPNDMDETVGPMKIFKDLAYGLAAKGISVYRYEKRTRTYSKKYVKAYNLTVQEEVIEDVLTAINLVKSDSTVDSTRIYLCGHSFGGMLLPRIARQTKDVKGFIFLAANATPLEDILANQTILMIKQDTSITDSKMLIDSINIMAAKIKSLKYSEVIDSTLYFRLPVSYWVDLKGYNPVEAAGLLKSRLLFLHGARDYQVSEVDFNMWKNGLKNNNATFRLYPSLNHFFIKGTGVSTPSEYTKQGNVDIQVINDIAGWIIPKSK